MATRMQSHQGCLLCLGSSEQGSEINGDMVLLYCGQCLNNGRVQYRQQTLNPRQKCKQFKFLTACIMHKYRVE
jgi:hypothetical protein